MADMKINGYEKEETAPIKPYELVTDDLIREALENDKGSDAKLLSWKIIPFTKKGDNYSSIVVSIEVKYLKNGTELHESYVAKINPLRAKSSITEVMEESYAREPVILSSIIGGMNKQLERLQLFKIRTPKLLSENLEKGKEVFITENLKNQGFIMHDRKIGLDLNHSLLVVNEIGRLHASSILFEEELYPKTLLETFPSFKRNFLDPNHNSYESLRKWFSTDAVNARNFLLNAGPKYKKCVEWLSKHCEEMIDFYSSVFSPKKPFDALIHADCWTNNMLFRYNEDNIPVEIRLVDLQLSVKASPVADLNYFLYSSVNGDFRLQNMNTLITSYYESFCNVFRRARKEPPFTYKELKQEIKNRKVFGLACGMLLLPIILADENDVIDMDDFQSEENKEFNEEQRDKFGRLTQKEGEFKERYLALFDEMLDSNIFDEKKEDTPPIRSYQLLTEDLVREALKNDKGFDAELLSWEINPFTKKGDNYSSIVVSIEVRFLKKGIEMENSFVAKINPLRPVSDFTDVMEDSYAREPLILSSIIRGMNDQLSNLKLQKIRIPKFLSQNREKGKEVLITENLRNQGFKMHDRKIGLDLNHSLLVVNEIGRLHASSILFEEDLYPKTLLETFPGFKCKWMDPNHDSFEIFRKMFIAIADNTRNFLLNAGPKYEICVKWLSKHRHEMIDFYTDVFSSKKPFDVLIHADCWINNILFKYNEDNIPVDIRLVDLQLSVKGTPIADLNYFLYSSVCRDLRMKHMNTLITSYYESFCKVFRRAGKESPFTYLELKEEMKNGKVFGLLCGMFLLPVMFAEGEDITDFDNLKSDEVDEFISEEQSKKFERLAQGNEPFKDRLLALFDEMIENNVFDETEDSLLNKSYALVTEDLVKEALKNAKGFDVQLLSWEVKPFTNIGDNYSSVVVAIEVNYQNNGVKYQDSFVAKLNPLRPESDFTEAMEQLYTRETVILSSVIEGMNKQLEAIKLDKIKTPKLFSRSIAKGRECFLTENLKLQGFEMYDRKLGLDLSHSLLVVKELGRFHASSILLEEELYPKTLLETFHGFERIYLDRNHSSFESYAKLFSSAAENARNFLQNAGPKYEECVKWLTEHSHEMVDIYLEAFSSKKPFDVLTHCDCWTNNFLFKYNEDNIPVDIRFVDLQLSVKGSPAADLNYFFYTSLNGHFRLENLNSILTTYYESFCNVLRRAGRQPPFTYTELKQEQKDKEIFGLTCGLLILPIILGEGEIFDSDNFTADKIDEFNQKQSKNFEKMAQREGPFKDRYMAMFDEMIESNVFHEI